MKVKDYLFISILIVLDQISKFFAKELLTGKSIEVIKDFFKLTYSTNTGAAFSLLEGRQWLFSIVAVLVCICILLYLQKEKVVGFEKLGFLAIIAGAIGNLIDRLRFGYVVDFLDFYIFGYDFPVFNLADCIITIGTALLLITIVFKKEK